MRRWIIAALILLGSLAGCIPPGQGHWPSEGPGWSDPSTYSAPCDRDRSSKRSSSGPSDSPRFSSYKK